MHPLLDQIFSRDTVTLAGITTAVHSGISLHRGLFLQDIVREVRPSISLEIGLAHGVSAMFICEALREVGGKKYIVIDPNQSGGVWGDGWNGAGLRLLKEAGFEGLRPGGVIVLCDTNWPTNRKVCRYILTNRDYTVSRCLYTLHDEAEWVTSRTMPPLPERLRRELRAELKEPDEELGLARRAECVALLKCGDDHRRWDFHEEF